jgi:uncharacterized protein (DUF362 family)
MNGFDVAKPVLQSSCIVTTCCLKTHGYGGVFTMSPKLSLGFNHKRKMTELHASFVSMRKMISEINMAYTPSLILLDGIEAFEQEQIVRAVELGLGVSRPEDIEIITDDAEGREYVERLRKILEQG